MNARGDTAPAAKIPLLNSRDGILLLAMGGPETQEEVEPFLLRMFSDPHLMLLPSFILSWLAPLIARRRAPISRRRYQEIGGGSPLPRHTRQLSEQVARAWKNFGGGPVSFGYRYSQPDTLVGLRALLKAGAEKVVALPLYPQYCRATVGSHLEEMRRQLRAWDDNSWVVPVKYWYQEPGFIALWAARIEAALASIPEEERTRTLVLFSAHGVPVRLARSGDPYLKHAEDTVAFILFRHRVPRWRLAYQSGGGLLAWSRPFLEDALQDAAVSGCQGMLVAPISFVCDNVETLYDLDIALAARVHALGLNYRRVPAFNDDPDLAEVLAQVAARHLDTPARYLVPGARA